MKKIALILALVLVFACALVACDTTETNSTPANESSVAGTESTPADESEPADESAPVDESEPADESTPAEESKEPVEAGDVLTNGMAYTTSEQFRQGGADAGWGWDDNAPIAYPDEDGKSLTDGAKDPGDNDYQNVVWAGFNPGTPTYKAQGYNAITFQFDESVSIAKTVVTIATSALGNGIGAENTTFEVFVSDDGETWTSVGTAQATDDASVNYVEVVIEGAGTGKYVEVRMVRAGWAFISEVEVYAAK